MTTRPGRGHRHLPKRLRLDCRPTHRLVSREIDEAIDQVRAAGTVPVLARHLNRRQDAERRLSVFGFEVAKTLQGYQAGHRMLILDLVRILNSFDSPTLARLGMPDWRPVGGYDRVDRLHIRVARELEIGWRDVDPDTGEIRSIDNSWYRTTVTRAPIPRQLIAGCALAVDGTAMETWGRLHGGHSIDGTTDDPDQDNDR